MAVQSRTPYATVGDFKEIVSRSVLNGCSEDALAIDFLELPLVKTTTFPHWVIAHLHSRKGTRVEESDLTIEASQAGYRISDMRFVKKFLENTQSNIGVWYDSKDKKVYYCWYEPDELTTKTQESLDRGDDW